MKYDGNIEKSFARLNDAIASNDDVASREAALVVGRCVVECLARIADALEVLSAQRKDSGK